MAPAVLADNVAVRIRPFHLALAGLIAVAASGCESSSTRPVPLPPLSAVVVAPPVDTVRIGLTTRFVAQAFDTTGAIVGGATFRWDSEADSIFTVTQTGLVRGVTEGTARLFVEAGGFVDTALVLVVPAQDGWYTQPSNANGANLHGVFFRPDGLHGWAVGDAGKILYTDDAGATWRAQTSFTSFSLHGVWFTRDSEGWVAGVNGTVLNTRNGGRTWTSVTTGTAETLRDLWFVDAARGYAVGSNGIILRTTDRGETWTKSFPTSATLRSVSFADANHGWAVGDGVIVGTHDGGDTWYVYQPAVTARTLHAVWRGSESFAVAVGEQGSAPRTIAGPDSTEWVLDNAGSAFMLEGLHFPSDSVGFAVGYDGTGTVLRAYPGPFGILWAPQVANTQSRLDDVFFVDERRGWAVGQGGVIIHTATGGQP
jgi:photosystem II stability/assembly factor-like uncharacterized protein